MSDIVERLQERARSGYAHDELSEEAADVIERLRADRDHWREIANTVIATLDRERAAIAKAREGK